MRYLGDAILLRMLRGRKSIPLATIKKVFRQIMITFWFGQKMLINGNGIFCHELKSKMPLIRILMAILVDFGSRVTSLDLNTAIETSIQSKRHRVKKYFLPRVVAGVGHQRKLSDYERIINFGSGQKEMQSQA